MIAATIPMLALNNITTRKTVQNINPSFAKGLFKLFALYIGKI